MTAAAMKSPLFWQTPEKGTAGALPVGVATAELRAVGPDVAEGTAGVAVRATEHAASRPAASATAIRPA